MISKIISQRNSATNFKTQNERIIEKFERENPIQKLLGKISISENFGV